MRPGRAGKWSGTTQVGLRWKNPATGGTTLFLFDGNSRLVVKNWELAEFKDRVTYSSWKNVVDDRFNVHKFEFDDNGMKIGQGNFIRVEETAHGLHNVEISGFGGLFRGSRGVWGAWNLWKELNRIELRYGNGEVYDGSSSINVFKNWQLGNGESFLNDKSDICEATIECGPTHQVQCVEDLNQFLLSNAPDQRSLQNEDTCDAECDDITHPLLRMFCKRDVEITGYNFWACQNAYNDPIIDQTDPPSCPSDCKNDAATGKFFIGAESRSHSCDWAIKFPKLREERCMLPEVALNCCRTCCSSCTEDAAGDEEFMIEELDFERSCDWVLKKSTQYRCSLDSVSRMCCRTCADALPSTSPSLMLSNAPSMPTPSPSSPPTGPCPSDCKGDATSTKFSVSGIGRRSCNWAKLDPLNQNRCALPEVALNCCESCCSSCPGDAAGFGKFYIAELDINRTCLWALRKDYIARCSIDSVYRMCCRSCAEALGLAPTEAPTQKPTCISVPVSGFPASSPTESPTPPLQTTSPSQSPTYPPTASPSTPPPTTSSSQSPTYPPTASPSTFSPQP